MADFDEYGFRRKVDSALGQVATILANTRNPTYAADVPHKYGDKYGLAEFIVNSAVAADLTVLELLGLTADGLKTLVDWAKKRSVTLRLKAEERCEFDREEKRKVESSTEHVTEVKSSVFGKANISHKTYTTVVEQFWKFDFEYELFAFRGNKPTSDDDRLVFQTRKGRIELKTTDGSKDSPPRPKIVVRPAIDVQITWMLNQIEADATKLAFKIDRNEATCKTPRRNPAVEESLNWFALFQNWCNSVKHYFRFDLFAVATGYSEEKSLDLASLDGSSLFVPVLPLFEDGVFQGAPAITDGKPGAGSSSSSAALESTAVVVPGGALVLASGALSATSSLTAVLPASDLAKFLQEQKRAILEKFGELEKTFPVGNAKLISTKEANMIVVLDHAQKITEHHHDGIEYIEFMLRKQLISAIGREIGPIDFSNYMRFHNRKLFREEYEPRPFSHAIRRPDHYPEGTVSIEAKNHDGTMAEPVYTTSRHIPAAEATPMRFPISASADVVFGGDRYLHAMVMHEFDGVSGNNMTLCARARQFSSFILVVGRIGGATLFEPKAAMIVQNRDELEIPLMLETIPTPKEFRDAIESLSPEQQRFCKAYRAMQLESTLFGIVVLQIKPQMEKLLNLPADSLTKEIRLTQDLMELFMKYQVPSDLVSFGGQAHVDASGRIAAVKQHVTNMYQMITESKRLAIEEARRKAEFEEAQRRDLELKMSLSFSGLDDMVEYKREDKDMRKKSKKKESFKEKKAMPSKLRSMAAPGGSAAAFGAASTPTSTASTSSVSSSVVSKPAPPSEAPAAAPVEAAPSSSTDTQTVPGNQTFAEDDIEAEDFTLIPTELDEKFEELDVDAALRPTIINLGTTWTKKYYESLLAKQSTSVMSTAEQSTARDGAYDLLDALTRSGVLAFDAAELHVLIAATHCFDKNLIDTVIQDNVNPIEKVERSSLIVATTIHNKEATLLIKADQAERVKTYSPMLFTPVAPAIEAAK
jgi:hypothetical protein